MKIEISEQNFPNFENADQHFLTTFVRFLMVCQGFDSNRSKSKSYDPGIVSSLLKQKISARKSIVAKKKMGFDLTQNQGNLHETVQTGRIS